MLSVIALLAELEDQTHGCSNSCSASALPESCYGSAGMLYLIGLIAVLIDVHNACHR